MSKLDTKALIAHWRDRHGDMCPGYARAPHEVKPKDFVVHDKEFEGGHPTVLCKECKKRATGE